MNGALRVPRGWPDTNHTNSISREAHAPKHRTPNKSLRGPISLLRITNDGYLYARKVEPPSFRNGGPVIMTNPTRAPMPKWAGWMTSAENMDQPETTSRRQLLRLREALSQEFPWSAVGFVSPQCSGALIAPNKVLTAGHCIWNAEEGAFVEGGDFYPNQHDVPARQSASRFLRRVKYAYRETLFTSARVYSCADGEL
eukprot:scaffold277473_cov48-Prasinocladus_malaysianus.AAC.1